MALCDDNHRNGNRTTLKVHGWQFSCNHGSALSSDDRDRLAHVLGIDSVVPLPEMVFGHNDLCLETIDDGLCITFSAEDGLQAWLEGHREQISSWDHTNFDFTFCSHYKGSIRRKLISAKGDDNQRLRIVRTDERIPLDKLLQHVEILYYDHVVLYEDDVRDLGEIYLEAKIRVMDFGFLVLCRYYCRVDEKMVKIVDTRYYHEFGDDFVWRDHEIREATIPLLRQRLYPSISAGLDQTTECASRDFGADLVYQALAPKRSVTEKIFLNDDH